MLAVSGPHLPHAALLCFNYQVEGVEDFYMVERKKDPYISQIGLGTGFKSMRLY